MPGTQLASALIEPTLINHVHVDGYVLEDRGNHVRVTYYVTRPASCGGEIRVAVTGISVCKLTYRDWLVAVLPQCMEAARDRPTLIMVN